MIRGILALLVLVLLAAPARAQSPTPTPVSVEPATVRVQSLPLFTVGGTETLSSDERGRLVEARVREVLRRYGRDLPPVTVERLGGSAVVRAGDVVLVTVVPGDLSEFDLSLIPAEERRALEAQVAERWAEALRGELFRATMMATPEYHLAAWCAVGILLVAAFLLHRLAGWLGRTYLRSPAWSLKFVVWSLALVGALWLFPESQEWGLAVYSGVLHPFLLLWTTLVAAGVASWVLEAAVHRYFVAYQRQRQELFMDRLSLRIATLDQAARVTLRVIVFVVALFVYLALLRVDVQAVITGAGVIGVALGLASQDFLKDVVAGANILLEDQFGVGDVIEWETLSGTVETFTLRATRVRTVDGRLVTVPNSSLRVVQNHSNGMSRVDFRVRISFEEDLEKALRVVKEEADALADEWPERILEPPVLLGVDSLSEVGPVLRVLLQTRPLSQWETSRELNKRVKLRFDREGIRIPYPQRRIWSAKEAP